MLSDGAQHLYDDWLGHCPTFMSAYSQVMMWLHSESMGHRLHPIKFEQYQFPSYASLLTLNKKPTPSYLPPNGEVLVSLYDTTMMESLMESFEGFNALLAAEALGLASASRVSISRIVQTLEDREDELWARATSVAASCTERHVASVGELASVSPVNTHTPLNSYMSDLVRCVALWRVFFRSLHGEFVDTYRTRMFTSPRRFHYFEFVDIKHPVPFYMHTSNYLPLAALWREWQDGTTADVCACAMHGYVDNSGLIKGFAPVNALT